MEMYILVTGKMIKPMEKVLSILNLGKYISSYGAEYMGEWKDDKQDGYGE